MGKFFKGFHDWDIHEEKKVERIAVILAIFGVILIASGAVMVLKNIENDWNLFLIIGGGILTIAGVAYAFFSFGR